MHKGLLCWAPIPAAGQVPQIRVLFLALEAAFAFVLWAFNTDKDFGGLSSMCPWDRDKLEYDGVCTHNPLAEKPIGEYGFTAEELEAAAAEKTQENRERVVRYQATEHGRAAIKARRATIMEDERHSCATCAEVFSDSNKLARHNASKLHADKVAIAEGRAAPKPHRCEICKRGYGRIDTLREHLKSKTHLLRVNKAARRPSSKLG